MDKHSDKIHENYREAAQRFEYFILGVSVALIAYAGKTLEPQRFTFSPYSLHVGAIALLIASVAIGFKRIEKIITFHQINFELLNLGEKRSALMKFLLEGGDRVDPQTSELWQPDDMKREISALDQIISTREKLANDLNATLVRLYKWRNALLILGFTGLFVSKVVTPYFH